MDHRTLIAAQARTSVTRITRPTDRQRQAVLAEETAYGADMRKGVFEHERMLNGRKPRHQGWATGTDYADRAGTSVWSRQAFGHIPEDVGCTVASLDYRQSRAKTAGKGAGGSLRPTATGGRRLMGA